MTLHQSKIFPARPLHRRAPARESFWVDDGLRLVLAFAGRESDCVPVLGLVAHFGESNLDRSRSYCARSHCRSLSSLCFCKASTSFLVTIFAAMSLSLPKSKISRGASYPNSGVPSYSSR